jgi:hypothetical protein
MKITITPSGSSATFVLADDTIRLISGGSALTNFSNGAGGQVREGCLNQQKRLVQKTPLFRAAYLSNIPRYNLENRFAFTTQRSFQTAEACLAFILFHPDSVPVQGEITIYNQSSTGLITRYLPNAVVDSVACVAHQEVACNITYSICGNGAWQTSP